MKKEILELLDEMDGYVYDLNFRLEKLGDTDSMEIFFLTEDIKEIKKLIETMEGEDGTL